MTVDVGPTRARGEKSTGEKKRRKKRRKSRSPVCPPRRGDVSFVPFFRWRSICCQLLGPLPKGLRVSEFSNSILRDFFPPRVTSFASSLSLVFLSVFELEFVDIRCVVNIFTNIRRDRDFECRGNDLLGEGGGTWKEGEGNWNLPNAGCI